MVVVTQDDYSMIITKQTLKIITLTASHFLSINLPVVSAVVVILVGVMSASFL